MHSTRTFIAFGAVPSRLLSMYDVRECLADPPLQTPSCAKRLRQLPRPSSFMALLGNVAAGNIALPHLSRTREYHVGTKKGEPGAMTRSSFPWALLLGVSVMVPPSCRRAGVALLAVVPLRGFTSLSVGYHTVLVFTRIIEPHAKMLGLPFAGKVWLFFLFFLS